MKSVAGLLAGLVALCLVSPAPVAVAGGAGCDGPDCTVTDPGGGSDSGGGSGGGSSSGPVKYPLCSGFPNGIYVAVGEDPSASGDALPSDIDKYVHATCDRGDGGLQWVWFDPGQSAEQLARSLLAQVHLEPIDVGIAPKAGIPAIVGMPVWLWADSPTRTTWGPATITAGGMTLTAEVESVTWDMGDGSKLSCGKGTEWSKGDSGESPTCSYVYEKRGKYTVRATSHWVAHWSGYGQSGDIPVTLSRSFTEQVDELQVVVTRG